MTNSFSVSKAFGIIAKLAAGRFEENCVFAKSVQKADEEDYKGKNGYGAGDTIYINQESRYVPQQTFDITSSIQGITETKVPLTLDVISTVGVETDSPEFASEIDVRNYYDRVIDPMVNAVVTDVEKQMLHKATKLTFNHVSTTDYGTDSVLSAREKMSKFLCPKDPDRFLLFDSTSMRGAVNARKGLYNSQDELAKAYKQGALGMADGYKWLENELLYNHTNGTDVSGVTVKTTVTTQGATTIVLTGVTASTGTITAGTVFTIPGIKAVHPLTKQAYTFDQQFTVITGGAGDGSTDVTVTVSPAMYTTGSLQNISAFPAATSPVAFVGSASTAYAQSLAFHKKAFRMASVPLVLPKNEQRAAQVSYKGINVAVVESWDVLKRRMVTRVDFLGGLASERPEWACRLSNS